MKSVRPSTRTPNRRRGAEKSCRGSYASILFGMPLTKCLEELGLKVSAEDIYAAISAAFQSSPGLSLSDLLEVIAKRISGHRLPVVSSDSNEVWACAARRIISTLLEDGQITIDNRLVQLTPTFGGKPADVHAAARKTAH